MAAATSTPTTSHQVSIFLFFFYLSGSALFLGFDRLVTRALTCPIFGFFDATSRHFSNFCEISRT
jgi:hypothetical protein